MGLSVTKPLTCRTNSDTAPQCTQASQQPESPVTQAAAINSTMQPCCSSTAEFAEDSVYQQHGTVCSAAGMTGNSLQQHTASKDFRAPLTQNGGCRRKQLSDNVDLSASVPLQNSVCYEIDSGTAGTMGKGRPRPSSWQRRRAAKLRHAQQDNQEGKWSCLIPVVDVQIIYTIFMQPMTNDLHCVLQLLRPVQQGHNFRGRSFRAAAAACQAAPLAFHTAISS